MLKITVFSPEDRTLIIKCLLLSFTRFLYATVFSMFPLGAGNICFLTALSHQTFAKVKGAADKHRPLQILNVHSFYWHSFWVLIYFQRLWNCWKPAGRRRELAVNLLSSWSKRERKHAVIGQRSRWSDEWVNVHWLRASNSSILFHIPLSGAQAAATVHLEQFHFALLSGQNMRTVVPFHQLPTDWKAVSVFLLCHVHVCLLQTRAGSAPI